MLQPRRNSLIDRLNEPTILLIFWASLTAIFAIVLLVPYGFLDDYYWLDLSTRAPIWIARRLLVQGRPLNGWLLYHLFHSAKAISNLAWLRWLTITGLAAMAHLLYRALRDAGWPKAIAFFTALAACTLPSCQVYAFWTTSVPIPLGGICAILAAMLVKRNVNSPSSSRVALILPAALMLVAATIYQPAAMIFFPIAALDLLHPRTRHVFRRAIIYILVAAVGLFADWLIFKLAALHHPDWVRGQRAGFTQHPLEKLTWFFQQPIVDSLNLFKLWPSVNLAIATSILLLLGLWLYFPGSALQRLFKLLIAAALIPLSYLPNLVTAEDWSSYRTQIGLAWLILLLLIMALTGIWRKLRFIPRLWRKQIPVILLAASTIFCACQAAFNVARLMVWPQTIELSLLKIRAASALAPDTTHVVFLAPDWFKVMTPFSRYDEIGRSSSWAPWVPYSAVRLLRREVHPRPPEISRDNFLIEDNFLGPWTQPLPPGTVLIDMRDIPTAHLTK